MLVIRLVDLLCFKQNNCIFIVMFKIPNATGIKGSVKGSCVKQFFTFVFSKYLKISIKGSYFPSTIVLLITSVTPERVHDKT